MFCVLRLVFMLGWELRTCLNSFLLTLNLVLENRINSAFLAHSLPEMAFLRFDLEIIIPGSSLYNTGSPKVDTVFSVLLIKEYTLLFQLSCPSYSALTKNSYLVIKFFTTRIVFIIHYSVFRLRTWFLVKWKILPVYLTALK